MLGDFGPTCLRLGAGGRGIPLLRIAAPGLHQVSGPDGRWNRKDSGPEALGIGLWGVEGGWGRSRIGREVPVDRKSTCPRQASHISEHGK